MVSCDVVDIICLSCGCSFFGCFNAENIIDRRDDKIKAICIYVQVAFKF